MFMKLTNSSLCVIYASKNKQSDYFIHGNSTGWLCGRKSGKTDINLHFS